MATSSKKIKLLPLVKASPEGRKRMKTAVKDFITALAESSKKSQK